MTRQALRIGGVTISIESDERFAVYDPSTHFLVSPDAPPDVALVLKRGTPVAPRGDLVFDSGGVWRLHRDGDRNLYTFDSPVHIGSFLFVDKDHGTPDRATAYGADGNVVSSVPIPVGANASVQTIDVNADNAVKLAIRYRDSGALTGIQICPEASTSQTEPTPTPRPQTTGSGTSNPPLVATPRTVKTLSLPSASLPKTAVLPAAMPRTGGSPEPSSETGTGALAAGLLALFSACAF